MNAKIHRQEFLFRLQISLPLITGIPIPRHGKLGHLSFLVKEDRFLYNKPEEDREYPNDGLYLGEILFKVSCYSRFR
jgi:hypothetical protein